MADAELARRVRIYVNEADTWRHQPTYAAILELLRREHCAGATVVRGVMGFTRGRIATASLVELASSLPVIVEWVDTPERVQRLLPLLGEMTPDGLITVEDVHVYQYPRRALQVVPPDLLVRDVMTPAESVVSAPLDAGLRELVVLLLRRGRHAIPVLDRARRVVGIVTNRDLTERAGLPLRLELLRGLGDPADPAVTAHLTDLHGEGRTAASIMTPEVATIGPEAPVAVAAQLLLRRRLKRLPVVDPDGHLLGMVSRFDLLKAAAQGGQGADSAEEPAARHPGSPPRQVSEVMQRRVPTVQRESRLPDVLEAVMSTRLHRAVVVDGNGKPLGIVIDTDLLPRLTPAAHPGVIQRLMQRVLPGTAEDREDWQRLTAERAADLMRPREAMVVVPADAALAGVIDQALARKVKLIVVIDREGRVVGMADRADLLAALAAI